MSLQVRGPGWFAVALATIAALFLLAFPVATQSPGNGRGQIVRINGVEAIEGEVLLKYRDDRVRANHAALEAAPTPTYPKRSIGAARAACARAGCGRWNCWRCSRRIPTSSTSSRIM